MIAGLPREDRKQLLAVTYTGIGSDYVALGETDLAGQYYSKALDTYARFSDPK